MLLTGCPCHVSLLYCRMRNTSETGAHRQEGGGCFHRTKLVTWKIKPVPRTPAPISRVPSACQRFYTAAFPVPLVGCSRAHYHKLI